MYEGPQATIDKVLIKGNDVTHDHVIRRELRTVPGAKFSRSDIIRSQRQIINLGYFDPESLGINTPINPQRGTVDIEYSVSERPNDQLEMSAGWGGVSGLIGTLGVTFNNFSARNMSNKDAWRPVPKGDGQRLSLRAQTNGAFYQSYNFSFTEPWLGGKKATSFTIGGYYTRFTNSFNRNIVTEGSLAIARGFVGLGTRLKWPDDNFITNTTLNIENINLVDYNDVFRFQGRGISDGSFNNFSIQQTIARTTINEPLFPRRGSKISLTIQLTPPYSLFRNDDFWVIDDVKQAELILRENENRSLDGDPELTDAEIPGFIFEEESKNRFHFLEYHKWRFDTEWYAPVFGKMVFRASTKMGFLGYYNKKIGVSPFERFELGGDGLNNQASGITGKDILRLRGYELNEVENETDDDAIIFSKFSLELRYPFSLNPNSTIYALAFVEGGNSWNRFKDYNPFDLKRSAGAGLRVFLPMFGLLGFDFGFGFDKPELQNRNAKWNEYGKFSLIIGFEPD
jgi:outer membrane protein insertion porin family